MAVRPWQHVLEPVNGYLLLGILLDTNAQIYSGAYNFGPLPTDHLPVNKLVDIAIDCWGSGAWIDTSESTHLHEANLLQLDITKAATVLNWKPKLTSTQAIEWTIGWYKQNQEDLFNYTLTQIKNYQLI